MKLEDIHAELVGLTAPSAALISTLTSPAPGMLKEVNNQLVCVTCDGPNESYYEQLVNERRLEAGLEADFRGQPLSWGKKLPYSPLIEHNNVWYLQTFLLTAGGVHYRYHGKPASSEVIARLCPKKRAYGQGLPEDKEVKVSTYRLDHVKSFVLVKNRGRGA